MGPLAPGAYRFTIAVPYATSPAVYARPPGGDTRTGTVTLTFTVGRRS